MSSAPRRRPPRAHPPPIALGLLAAASAGAGLLAWRAASARATPDVAILAGFVVVLAGAASWSAARAARLERAHLVDEADRAALAERLERLTRHSRDMVILADEDQRIVEANDRAVALLGYSRDELLRMRISDLRDPATLGDYEERVRQEILQGAALFSTRYRRRDGSTFPVEVSVSATVCEGRSYFEGIARDVSERARAELAGRMASVGTLAAGVAHEINNPLSFILSNLDFAVDALRRGGGDPAVLSALDDARDGGARVREIVRDLKTFSRASDGPTERVDVRRVLHSAIGLAANEIRHRAALVVDPGDVPPVVASEHRLGQVFLNLLINAAQAIPEGRAAEHVVRVTTATAPDGRALVEVSDTGTGISPEVLPRIFDPFFTTKPVGVGTGLGLSICHGLVSQLGGEIVVDSAPGAGSTFRVLLPPAPAAADVGAAAPPAPEPSPERAPRRGRVLVIDDDALVGRAVARVLAAEHEVVTRTSARAALDELLCAPGRFDVVLCDLMMPELDGMQLHAALAGAAPALAERTVFLTGGAFTPAARAFLDAVPNACLEKPFDPGALRDLVARVLSARRAPVEA